MKRVITFMMALALILSLSVTAFAAGTGSITVNNTLNDVNYKLYKIFDATYKADSTDADGDGSKDVVSYSLETTSPVYDYMFVADATKTDLFVRNPETGVVTKGNNATDEAIITYLTAMVREMYNVNTATGDGCFVANQVANSSTTVFSNLAYGYYLVDTENAEDNGEEKAKIAVTITTNTPDVSVIEKNKAPGDLDKDADKDSVKVGDNIEWTVSFLATNYDGSEKVVEYTITDTLSSAWAAYNFDANNTTNITVVVGDQTLVAGTDYTLVMTETDDGKPGFVVTIPWANVDDDNNVTSFKYDALETVTITYSATVLESAANNPDLKNTADLDWERENGTPGVGDDDVEGTKIHNLGFTKLDGDTDTTLAGAEFALYSDAACTEPVYVKETSTAGVYIFDKDATTENGSNTVITPEGGKVVIQGLGAGTYYLKETKAPDGYNKLADPVEVTIVADEVDKEGNVTKRNGSEITVAGTTYYVNHTEVNVENFSGVELPSTGGKGTMMMITIGTMVAMAFAVLLITQKKMSIYQD